MILWSLRYILYFDYRTFAPQCEVKIVVFIVLHINANFAYCNFEFMLIFVIISAILFLHVKLGFDTPVLSHTNVRLSVRPFHMSRSNLRTPRPIHFTFHRVIEIGGLTVCILYGEISNFHSRVMGLYSSNCRRFFVYRPVNWEPLGQFTSNFG